MGQLESLRELDIAQPKKKKKKKKSFLIQALVVSSNMIPMNSGIHML
jgi:hypothetical protein